MLTSNSIVMIRCRIFLSVALSLIFSVDRSRGDDVYHVALVGESVELHCPGRSLSDVKWDFYSPEATHGQTLWNGNSVSSRLSDPSSYKLSNREGMNFISISPVRQTVAGKYTCFPRTTARPTSTVWITVLAAEPNCSSAAEARSDVTLSNVRRLRCHIYYSGIIHPQGHCRIGGSNRTVQLQRTATLSNTGTFRRVELWNDVNVEPELNTTLIVCATFFSTPDSPHRVIRTFGIPSNASNNDDSGEDEHHRVNVTSYTATERTTNRPATSNNSNDNNNSIGIFLAVVCGATFITFLIAVIYMLCRSTPNGAGSSSNDKPDVVPYASGDGIIRQYIAQLSERSLSGIVMNDVSGDVDEPVPPVPNKPQWTKEDLMAINADEQSTLSEQTTHAAVTSIYIECIADEEPVNSVPVGPVYAELSVPARPDLTESRVPQTSELDTTVYANINHTLKTAKKKRTKKHNNHQDDLGRHSETLDCNT